jgi:RuvA, C-terminal domain
LTRSQASSPLLASIEHYRARGGGCFACCRAIDSRLAKKSTTCEKARLRATAGLEIPRDMPALNQGRLNMAVVTAATGACDWKQAHEHLVRLAKSRAGLELEEGKWLLAAQRAGTHQHLGYGSVLEYAERLFGHAPRLTHEKLRVAAALERLPELEQALASGELTWSAVRELTRVATPETERVWREHVRCKTVREVEKLVSGRRPGSLPTDPAEAGLERHVLRFEVSGEVLATFREALAEVRRKSGGPLDDDAALLLMARQVLSGTGDGTRDAGKASYQVALTLCEGCRLATQTGHGEPVTVSEDLVATAECDAQLVPLPQVGERTRRARATQTIPPAQRRAVLRRDHGRCQAPGCRHAAFVDLHHLQHRVAGGPHEHDNLVTLCGAHHRALHHGALRIEGCISTGLRFFHADGRPYGAPPTSSDFDLRARVVKALRGLGFAEREAQRAVVDAETHVGSDATLEHLLRAALEVLTPRAS